MANRTNTLTPKQQAFCRAVVSGCTMSDAYREAYSTSNMKPATVNREAYALMADPKITARVETLQRAKDRAVIACGVSDRDLVLTQLRTLATKAEGKPAEHVILRAVDLLGKTQGMYKEVQVQETPRTAAEIQAELEEKLAAILGADKAVH